MYKYIAIGNRMYDVVPFDTYLAHPDMYDTGVTAVERDGYAYPLRYSKSDPKPGIYVTKGVSILKEPEDYSQYDISKCIDFSDISTIRDAMTKSQMVKDLANSVLAQCSDVTTYSIQDTNKPIMIALKTAVNNKHCDTNSYQQRFGSNFNNDMRLFNKDDISLNKAVSIAENLDMKVTIKFENASEDVTNPMNESVTMVLTGRKDEATYPSSVNS